MTKRAYATAVSGELEKQGYGFSIDEILLLIDKLLPYIQKLPCFKKNVPVMSANMAEEYRQCLRKQGGRITPEIRKAMRSEGYEYRSQQNNIWKAMNHVGFVNSTQVATLLVNA